MTYEEAYDTCQMAIKYVTNKINSESHESFDSFIYGNFDSFIDGIIKHIGITEDFKIMAKAVKKQIPVKPKYVAVSFTTYTTSVRKIIDDRIMYAVCPICSNELHNAMQYCDNCGQRLSWQEEGDEDVG